MQLVKNIERVLAEEEFTTSRATHLGVMIIVLAPNSGKDSLSSSDEFCEILAGLVEAERKFGGKICPITVIKESATGSECLWRVPAGARAEGPTARGYPEGPLARADVIAIAQAIYGCFLRAEKLREQKARRWYPKGPPQNY